MKSDATYQAAPFEYLVQKPRFIMNREDAPSEKIWWADVTCLYIGQKFGFFKDIAFIEEDGMAFIAGIELPDNDPRRNAQYSRQQSIMIRHLRTSTRMTRYSRGMIGLLLSDWEYDAEKLLMRAYVASRDTDLGIGIGYVSYDRSYQLIRIAADDFDDEHDSAAVNPGKKKERKSYPKRKRGS